MKKLIVSVGLIMLIFSLPSVVLSQVYFIAEKDGHIYNQPHESSLVLSNFVKGQITEWRTLRTPEDWLAVKVGNISGYVRKKDGKVITDASNPDEAFQIYRFGYPLESKM
jgi:hypothetical protein